jgi:hypothetical protein
MKNNLRTIFILTVFCAVFGCAGNVSAQIKTGGYKSASVSDAGVKAAAQFAVETKASEMEQELSLEGIISAETQTVAGTNYRLCLQIYAPAAKDGEDGVTTYIKTVIYKNLQGEYKITSWEDEDCAEK